MGDYIDLEFFQSYTRTTYSDSTTPTSTEVESFIELSEQEINEKTGRTWAVTTHTDELYDLPSRDLLLKSYPVLSVTSIKDKDRVTLTEGIDNDYVIDGDFVVFRTDTLPTRVYVSYTSGYTNVRAAAKMLATLLTIQKIKQSQSTLASNSTNIKVGPISITNSLGMQTVLNLETDISKYWKELRRLIR